MFGKKRLAKSVRQDQGVSLRLGTVTAVAVGTPTKVTATIGGVSYTNIPVLDGFTPQTSAGAWFIHFGSGRILCIGEFGSSVTETGALTINSPAGAANKCLTLPEGYSVYTDNTGAGSDPSRLWVDTPDGGEVVIGPRSGAETLGNLRLRSGVINLEGAFNGWNNVSFQNSWQNFGGNYQLVEYRKIGDIVYVHGLARKNATFSTAETMFTLPSGFRPTHYHVWNCRVFASSSEYTDRIDLLSDGQVQTSFGSTSSSGNWVSFHHQFSTI